MAVLVCRGRLPCSQGGNASASPWAQRFRLHKRIKEKTVTKSSEHRASPSYDEEVRPFIDKHTLLSHTLQGNP